jgi:hypothetical protein
MPTSASPKRNVRPPPPPRSRFLLPLIVLVAVAVLVVFVIALPASLVQRFLPPTLHAEDFSGSVWHGSAGRLLVNNRDAGAVEWRIHPASLLALTLSVNLHWVKVGFVADAVVEADRQGAVAHDVIGGGPLEDLRDFGILPGWRGGATFKFSELKIGFESGPNAGDGVALRTAVGEVRVADVSAPQIAAGGDLGGYALHLANGAITPDTDLTAELADTGGPVQLNAVIHYSVKEHTGLLSGTVKERPEASAALRADLQNLSQLHARDAQGRIPVELEFTL